MSKFGSTQSMKDYILGIPGQFYEASARDRLWGIGISVDEAENGAPHRGENKLGKALDRVKARLSKPVCAKASWRQTK